LTTGVVTNTFCKIMVPLQILNSAQEFNFSLSVSSRLWVSSIRRLRRRSPRFYYRKYSQPQIKEHYEQRTGFRTLSAWFWPKTVHCWGDVESIIMSTMCRPAGCPGLQLFETTNQTKQIIIGYTQLYPLYMMIIGCNHYIMGKYWLIISIHYISLSGWCFQPLWKIQKSVGMIIPNWMGK